MNSIYKAKIAFEQAKNFEKRIENRVQYLEKETKKYEKKIDSCKRTMQKQTLIQSETEQHKHDLQKYKEQSLTSLQLKTEL